MRPEIQTISGRAFNFADVRPEMISIKDMAHSLAHLCRYTGHSPHHYSIAEHSIRVALEVPKQYRLEALLHDGSEYVLGDVSSPLKQMPEFAGYRVVENRVQNAIYERFGIRATEESHTIIKAADYDLLAVEAAEFYGNNYIGNWGDTIKHGKELSSGRMKGKFAMFYDPYKARELFLQTFQDFGGIVC
jgi:hypothetical protein